MTSALLTDKYELTMLQAALAAGTAGRRCVFELFARRLPGGRRYGVVAGTGRFIEELAEFTFDDQTLKFLEHDRVVDRATLDFLADYRFDGSISGYAEGECYFPGSPVITVEADFAHGVVLETLLLSVLNHDSAVASAASRMANAAGGRPCLEMGARRTHERAALGAARAAYIAGFSGTSVLEAGRRWGIPTIGTAAHAFTLLHDDELSAFRAQIASLGTDTTLLVDTYDVAQGVRNAIEAGGTELASVRIDSGDLTLLADEVRAQLDALGAVHTKIVVTSDLDEHAIAALGAHPVDSYGVGTALVTGSGAPTAEMVYKLVARENSDGTMQPVAKAGGQKATVGGVKHGYRRLDPTGQAVEEVVFAVPDGATFVAPEGPETLRPLQVTYVDHGTVDWSTAGTAGMNAAVARHRHSVAELPRSARRLSVGEPAIPTAHVPYQSGR